MVFPGTFFAILNVSFGVMLRYCRYNKPISNRKIKSTNIVTDKLINFVTRANLWEITYTAL
jgi:hypothetical protein